MSSMIESRFFPSELTDKLLLVLVRGMILFLLEGLLLKDFFVRSLPDSSLFGEVYGYCGDLMLSLPGLVSLIRCCLLCMWEADGSASEVRGLR